jgi:hypothetical protein
MVEGWEHVSLEDLEVFDVGDYGLGYLVCRLCDLAGLPYEAAEVVRSTGRVQAVAPKGATADRVRQFESGGGLNRYGSWLALYLQRNTREGSTLLLYDGVDDQQVIDIAATTGKTYRRLTSFDEESVIDLLSEIDSFYITAFLFEPETRFVPGELIDERSLARDVSTVFINIYNQESWLIWTRV